MNQRWLFIVSCIALITSAFTFSVRGDVLQAMGEAFGLTQELNGFVESAVFWGMAGSMLFGGFICDALGLKKIMILAFLSHIGGSIGTIYAPKLATPEASAWWLFATSFLMGCGNGFTEVAINPLVATLYPKEKTHYLNILHAWWPGGLVIGGLSALVVGKGLHLGSVIDIKGLGFEWYQSLWLIVIPAILYGLMLIPSRFPQTERVASGVSNADMFKEILRPMFLLWMFCMLLTAATELGPQKWQESVMQSTAGFSGTLILVYTSGMMFVLRHFAGPIAHALSPVGMLTGSSILSAAGLYLLSTVDRSMSGAVVIAYATIFGLGIAYFWPTMLGVAAERFPKGGALALAIMGTAGNASIAFVLPQIGKISDDYAVAAVRADAPDLASQVINAKGTALNPDWKNLPADSEAFKVADAAQATGFSAAFRWVSVLPCILVVIFGAIAISDKLRGGYRPEILLSRQEENELFAGGVQAPVE